MGLRHVIISPGSRSTPLVMAFAAHSGIKKHVVLDERSAAFIALGIGMQSGNPAALVCTSGTAVANYFPAVIESKMSEIPMLVFSADRPQADRDVGANQAIDQIQLFGNKTVYFADTGLCNLSNESVLELRKTAHAAWNTSKNISGCSHINFPFKKPLEPNAAFIQNLSNWYSDFVPLEIDSPLDFDKDEITLDATTLKLINQCKRPVVLCGPSNDTNAVANIAEHFSKSGVPILIEPGSTNRRLSLNNEAINHFNAFLRHEETCKDLSPDLIIKIGGEPVGKGVEKYLNYHKNTQSIHFHTYTRVSNPAKLPQIRVPAGNGYFKSTSPEFNPEPSWLNKWKTMAEQVHRRRQYYIKNDEFLRDGDIHSILTDHLSTDDILMVSNSFPVRDLDLFGAPTVNANIIYMSRGASGIDGITSTTVGLSIASDRPIYLITGDLAFMHDINALLSFKLLTKRLIILVINNNGGSIFRMLPAKKLDLYFRDYFETPQDVDIQKICASFGVNCFQVNKAQQLNALLESNQLQHTTVIECVTDPDQSMKQRTDIWGS